MASWFYLRWLILLAAVFSTAIAVVYFRHIWMPGSGRISAAAAAREPDEAMLAEMQRHVAQLAGVIGERNTRNYKSLQAAADYVERELAEAGLRPRRLPYPAFGLACDNIEAEVRGTARPEEILVVGAHYDSAPGTPGANDNATGVAALLSLARHFSAQPQPRTVRFVAFVNEEPPFFQQPSMGSLVYARMCRDRGDQIVGMLSLETIGYFDSSQHSQLYPPGFGWFYPDQGDFIGFVGDHASRRLVHAAIRAFRAVELAPSEGAALPRSVHAAGLSDHWSFWHCGYPALMVTDTAMFRYPHYHQASDTPEKVDYPQLARVVTGLRAVIRALADETVYEALPAPDQ